MKVPASSFGLDSSYTDRGISSFSTAAPGKCHDIHSNLTTNASFYVLYNLLFFNHLTIRRYIL